MAFIHKTDHATTKKHLLLCRPFVVAKSLDKMLILLLLCFRVVSSSDHADHNNHVDSSGITANMDEIDVSSKVITNTKIKEDTVDGIDVGEWNQVNHISHFYQEEEQHLFHKVQRRRTAIKKPTRRPTRRPNKRRPTRRPTRRPLVRVPTPTAPTLSEFATKWLTAHNTRRTTYYSLRGLGPKDLTWSTTLEESAQTYANTLLTLDGCQIQHDDQYEFGENLAANSGTGIFDEPRSAEGVLSAWFEYEQNLPFGLNFHFTQVAWRATSELGCGQAQKPMADGGTCYVQVCRYYPPHFCGGATSSNWQTKILQDNVSC